MDKFCKSEDKLRNCKNTLPPKTRINNSILHNLYVQLKIAHHFFGKWLLQSYTNTDISPKINF